MPLDPLPQVPRSVLLLPPGEGSGAPDPVWRRAQPTSHTAAGSLPIGPSVPAGVPGHSPPPGGDLPPAARVPPVLRYTVENGHLVTWSLGHMSLGHLVTWSLGHLATWSLVRIWCNNWSPGLFMEPARGKDIQLGSGIDRSPFTNNWDNFEIHYNADTFFLSKFECHI